jgi:hypothetical protein
MINFLVNLQAANGAPNENRIAILLELIVVGIGIDSTSYEFYRPLHICCPLITENEAIDRKNILLCTERTSLQIFGAIFVKLEKLCHERRLTENKKNICSESVSEKTVHSITSICVVKHHIEKYILFCVEKLLGNFVRDTGDCSSGQLK